MTKIYFTSDCHFNHTNIMKYSGRNFYNIGEMNDELIFQHNELVKPNDIVYNLGDFTFQSVEGAVNILKQLNGRHRFIRGNHDSWLFDKSSNDFNALRAVHDELLRQGSSKEKVEWIQDYYEFRDNGTLYCLMHFPLFTWHHSYKGSINLYGHCHAGIEHMVFGRQMDVGVDNAYRLHKSYRPFSIEEITERLLQREIKCPEMEQIRLKPWDKSNNGNDGE